MSYNMVTGARHILVWEKRSEINKPTCLKKPPAARNLYTAITSNLNVTGAPPNQ